MTIQIIRRDGKIRGIAFFVRKAKLIEIADETTRYWRICDHCAEREAFVFCRSHAKHICDRCITFHGRKSYGGAFIDSPPCQMMSISVVKSLVEEALKNEETPCLTLKR